MKVELKDMQGFVYVQKEASFHGSRNLFIRFEAALRIPFDIT